MNKILNKYRATVRHDYGTVNIIVMARTRAAAINQVRAFENCPVWAIKSLRKIK
jgi:hypothetical protein